MDPSQPAAAGVDFTALAQTLLDYAHKGNYRMLIAVALSGVVWFLRDMAIRPVMLQWPGIGPVLSWLKNTNKGGLTLTLVLGIAGGLITTLKAGVAINVDLMVTALINGLLASGFFVALKHYSGLSDKAPEAVPMPILPEKPQGRRAAVFVPFLLLFGLTVPSCACFQPAHAQDIGCIIERQVIDCTTPNVQPLLEQLKPLLAWLFSGATGPLDGDAILAALIQSGAKVVGCTAADLALDFSKPSGDPVYLARAHEANSGLSKVKSLMHVPGGVKFKLAKAGGAVVYQ